MRIKMYDGAGQEQGLVLQNREGVVSISYTELEYVEVINKTVTFHLTDGAVHEVSAALADIEGQLLSRPEFLKTHRSYLVNLRHVRSIDADYVMTKSGHSIPISRKRRSLVQDAYMNLGHLAEMETAVTDVHAAGTFDKTERPAGPWRILMVDDDPADRRLWADVLRRHGCVVRQAENGSDALQMAADESYDCVLLDVMIPDEDGFSICEELRKLVQAPVIFLSSLTESDKQVKGFAAGGIDYITKDTSEELFWAKVETRIKLAMSDRTQMRYGSLLLDLTERRALIHEKELPLTPIEFDILWKISERAGYIFTPEEIFGMVWGSQPWDGGQMVQMHMARLRRKLERAEGEQRFIETVWGQGYRFVSTES
ncbi:MAG: response regulator [Lachnospiraceae bacterium]|nr:response regulator [Lachnospiraceae bacterium]